MILWEAEDGQRLAEKAVKHHYRAVIDAGDWRNRGEDFDLGFVFLPKRIGKGLLQAILIFGSTAWEVKSGQGEIVLAELADKQ